MKYAMTDIETAGVEPAGAAIISVGCVVYDELAVIDHAVWNLDPMWTPGRRDKGTFAFWSEEKNRQAALGAFSGKMLPWDFCESYSEFMSIHDADEQWADPPRFDFGHLRELYHVTGHAFPFSYRDERDLRTLKKLAIRMHPSLEEELRAIVATLAHDPLADAEQQMREHQLIMRALGLSLDEARRVGS